MSIQTSEMIWRQPVERSDAGSNGGRMTATVIPTKVKNSIWPDVPQSERTLGSTKYRKVFIHIANADDLTLVRPRLFVETYSPGDDSVTIAMGTMSDTESGLTGSEQQYGSGDLNAAASILDTSIDVLTEGVALDYFKDGMLIRISDKATVDDAGNEQYVTISGAPTYVGDVATIAFTPALDSNYAAAGATRVASVIEPADVTASADAVSVVTGNTGTYDDTTHPITIDGVSSIKQDWTLTFSNATDFTLTSNDPALAISIASNISSTLQPNNPDFGTPYFILDQLGYGGIFQAGDTIDFTTHAAAIPVWYKRFIPSGANSLTGDKVIIGLDGESA